MQVNVVAEVSYSSTTFTVDTKDLGYTDEEWEALSEDEKKDALQQECDGLPESPSWMLDSYREK